MILVPVHAVAWVIVLLSWITGKAYSFVFRPTSVNCLEQHCQERVICCARRRKFSADHDEDDDDLGNDDDVVKEKSIPQLPSRGASISTGTYDSNVQESAPQPPPTAFVRPKMELQYTCNVCNTRNMNLISRIAYQQGVVIATCKGCQTKHIIADNLSYTGGLLDGTIEDLLPQSVNRVSPDVFHLERVLNVDTRSGSIIGEDGQATME